MEDVSVLDGLLLGDASLNCNSATPRFILTNGQLSYIEAIRNLLPLPFSRIHAVAGRNKMLLGRMCSVKEYFQLYSLTDLSLLEHYVRWHRNRKKVIPSDIQLTPITVLHWFYCDGSTSFQTHRCRKITYTAISLSLATNGFTREDVSRLRDLLLSLNSRLLFKIYPQVNGYVLRSSSTQTLLALYDYILPAHSFRCFDYKFKLPSPTTRKNMPSVRWIAEFHKRHGARTEFMAVGSAA